MKNLIGVDPNHTSLLPSPPLEGSSPHSDSEGMHLHTPNWNGGVRDPTNMAYLEACVALAIENNQSRPVQFCVLTIAIRY
jgi:hypothetical protein